MLPRVELDLAPRIRAEFRIAVAFDPLDVACFCALLVHAFPRRSSFGLLQISTAVFIPALVLGIP